MKVMKKLGVGAVAATIALTAGSLGVDSGVLAARPSPQAFTDCSTSRVCLWTGQSYTGSRYSYSSSGYTNGGGGNFIWTRSFGNRFSNHNAYVYNSTNGDLIIAMAPNTGSSNSTQFDAYSLVIS